jgi:hypothetical protein
MDRVTGELNKTRCRNVKYRLVKYKPGSPQLKLMHTIR